MNIKVQSVKAYKGFDKDLKCRDFQYEIGGEYTEEKAKMCQSGFHACENPFDVFSYYNPADSRYCEVELGELDEVSEEHGENSKICGRKIKIGTEIGLMGLIKAGVNFIFEKIDWENDKKSNTGYRSAATNTGFRSAATNTGDWSAATNTGDWSAAIVEGKDSVAMSMGIESKAKGAKGCWIVLAEWKQDDNGTWNIDQVKTQKVDGEIIKADTFYMLQNGKFVETE